MDSPVKPASDDNYINLNNKSSHLGLTGVSMVLSYPIELDLTGLP